MSYTTIIFDYFGVFTPDIFNEWSKVALNAETKQKLRAELMPCVDLGKVSRHEFFTELSRCSGWTIHEIETWWEKSLHVDEELVRWLKGLSKTYTVCLCSNAATWEIRHILEKFDLEKAFDFVIVSAEVGYIKPEEDMFTHTLSVVGSVASETVFIDDNQANIDAAERLSIKGILYTNVSVLKTELAALDIKID